MASIGSSAFAPENFQIFTTCMAPASAVSETATTGAVSYNSMYSITNPSYGVQAFDAGTANQGLQPVNHWSILGAATQDGPVQGTTPIGYPNGAASVQVASRVGKATKVKATNRTQPKSEIKKKTRTQTKFTDPVNVEKRCRWKIQVGDELISCGEYVENSSAYNIHVETVHIGSTNGREFFECGMPECNFKVGKRDHIISHTVGHCKAQIRDSNQGDIKVFKCGESNCTYRSARQTDLKRHVTGKHGRELKDSEQGNGFARMKRKAAKDAEAARRSVLPKVEALTSSSVGFSAPGFSAENPTVI